MYTHKKNAEIIKLVAFAKRFKIIIILNDWHLNCGHCTQMASAIIIKLISNR